MRDYQYLLFDLDGTLTDSADGILNSVLYALGKMGRQTMSREQLLAFVGPPLLDSFRNCCGMSTEEGEQATVYYREYFKEKGWMENRVYDGIPEALARLKDAGKKLYIATSKPEVFAKNIAEHFGIAGYFEEIIGASLDGSVSKKGDVIDLVIRKIGETHRSEILMIGDRDQDVNGAAQNRIPCLGVLYGYGSREELERAGADRICRTPQELTEILL